MCNRDLSSVLSSFWLALIGSCVGQPLIDQEDIHHFFPNLKTSTLQIPSLLSQQHVATYRRRPTGTSSLTINTSKIQVLCINAIPDAPTTAGSKPLDLVEAQPGKPCRIGNAAQKDIRARLGKPRVTGARLRYNLRTKLTLYNSIVNNWSNQFC